MPLELRFPAVLKNVASYPEIRNGAAVAAHPGVAELFQVAGLDAANPLGQWIQPGMQVLIKPNWVRHAAEGWSEIHALVTHPSIIAATVEAVAKALRTPDGSYAGRIVLADAPLQSARFDLLMQQCGVDELLKLWRKQGIPIELRDLRKIVASVDDASGIVETTEERQGDPSGDTIVDLGSSSRLEALTANNDRFGVSNYDSDTTSQHHRSGVHRYRIANSLLDADVIVNLPKWKTHVKTGVTGALKNFIGINCDKAFLPHFRVGPPRKGGDEYPDSVPGALLACLRPWLERVMPVKWIRSARKSLLSPNRSTQSPLIFGGAWPGNDTLWRTIHDMVWIATWLGRGGEKREQPRTIVSILDAIVAGEGDGPLRPEAAAMGCLLLGTDAGMLDIVASALSGLDWKVIPMLSHLTDPEARQITLASDDMELPEAIVRLRAPASWARQLQKEIEQNVAA
jgi:uncharacterized protein (DUF362 family)